MAIDFPNSPSQNDIFTAGNKQWTFDGVKWVLASVTPLEASLELSISTPQNGEALVYNAETGKWENSAVAAVGTVGSDVSQIWTVINSQRGVSITLGSSATGNLAGSGIVRLAVGDTFGMAAWFNGGSVTITANSFHTFLRIRYLG